MKLKSKENFANQINGIDIVDDEVVFVCMDGISMGDEVIEKLKEIILNNEHHAVVGPVFFLQASEEKNNSDFFDIVPFVSSKCFMIRTNTLKNLGGFNSEIKNADACLAEYCARINAYGYSTILANFATTANDENLKISSGFNDEELILISKKINKYNSIAENVTVSHLDFKRDPFVHFKSFLTSAEDRKPRLLFSFQNLMASFNGTAEYSFALLQSFVALHDDKYKIDVIVHRDAWSFHKKNFPENISVFYFNQDENRLPLYDMIFSSAQIWEMKYIQLFNRLSPRIVVAILDAIVWRSGYLEVSHASGYTSIVGRFTMRYCNGFLAISETARKDILSFFHNVDTSSLLSASILLGTGFCFQEENRIQNKMLTEMYSGEISKILSKKYILIFGNGLKHKSVREAHAALVDVDMHKVYIGMNGGKFKNEINSSFFHSGGMPDSLIQDLYRNAHLLVFPSQYEGFGLPIIKSIEYQKKIIIFNSEINHEVVDAFVKNEGQAIFFDFFSQLPSIINDNLEEYLLEKTQMRTWDDVTNETEIFFQKIIQAKINPTHLRDRWFNLKLMELENGNSLSIQKLIEFKRDFVVNATVFKKKFFPKKLF